MFFFFFFKQKTAYEMRISDWSSDVCSSDLGGDPGLVVLDHVGRRRVLVERAGLVLLDPDADQVARDVVTLRQTVQRLAGEKLLRDLTLEVDAMGTVNSEERRVGKECVSKFRSRESQYY